MFNFHKLKNFLLYQILKYRLVMFNLDNIKIIFLHKVKNYQTSIKFNLFLKHSYHHLSNLKIFFLH